MEMEAGARGGVTILPSLEGVPRPVRRLREEPAVPIARAVYITYDALQRHGYTASCRKCVLMRQGVGCISEAA